MDLVDFGRYAGGLLVTLGLIAALAYAARRFNFMQLAGGAKGGRMRLVETLMIDARRRAALIRVDGREHVLVHRPSVPLVGVKSLISAVRGAKS